MAVSTIGGFRDLIEVVVTGVSILGGAMAFYSGLEAQRSFRIGANADHAAFRINRGLARGFEYGLPAAVLVATLLALI